MMALHIAYRSFSEAPMMDLLRAWSLLETDRRAVTALEYGLIAGVLVGTIVVGFSLLANSLSTEFNTVGASL